MAHLRFNHDPDGHAIAQVAGVQFNPGTDVSICRVSEKGRLGGVIFYNFTGESISLHVGSWDKRWISHDMLWVTFDYPFQQLGVNRIFGMVPEENLHAQEFNVKLGFHYVARIEGFYRGNIACMVMCLERSDCRFLSMKPRRYAPGRKPHEAGILHS